jgi:hypothetical protein
MMLKKKIDHSFYSDSRCSNRARRNSTSLIMSKQSENKTLFKCHGNQYIKEHRYCLKRFFLNYRWITYEILVLEGLL